MVYIHGGGYDIGFSNYQNGLPLTAIGDVITITFNYRLGPFGFLTAGKTKYNSRVENKIKFKRSSLVLF